MNKVQKFTPKYWVGHDNTTDDVFIETASKSRSNAVKKMEHLIGFTEFRTNDKYETILIEVNWVYGND